MGWRGDVHDARSAPAERHSRSRSDARRCRTVVAGERSVTGRWRPAPLRIDSEPGVRHSATFAVSAPPSEITRTRRLGGISNGGWITATTAIASPATRCEASGRGAPARPHRREPPPAMAAAPAAPCRVARSRAVNPSALRRRRGGRCSPAPPARHPRVLGRRLAVRMSRAAACNSALLPTSRSPRYRAAPPAACFPASGFRLRLPARLPASASGSRVPLARRHL